MASFADARSALDELRRRAPEWGTLERVLLVNRMGTWHLIADWAALDAEPRYTLPGGSEADARVYVNHRLCVPADAPLPEALPPIPVPAADGEADGFGF